jgi:RNA polymerase sigma-70 factor (ECF subfamily)
MKDVEQSAHTPGDMRATLDAVYASDARSIFASLIRLLGDFDLAEEALQDAFMAALEQWPRDGVPVNPRTWLISAGRFKAIDRLRKRARFNTPIENIVEQPAATEFDPAQMDEQHLEDDQLRLIFTCCHPALQQEAQIALTLREVCGLTTEEIARAFLTSTPTIAKRIVRAKAKIREARIPYEVPSPRELPARLDSVLCVIYLIFTEGYSASSGSHLTRADLSREAIRLGRLLTALLDEPEAVGLLALMLLQESRHATRISTEGEVVLLEDQDRSKWDRPLIQEGVILVERALASRRFGPYTLQAAIAAVHAESHSPEATDWNQIAGLYSLLLRINPSPVVELNRAVAIAQRDGAASGVALIDAIFERGDLKDYYLAYATHADFCRKMGKLTEAIESYRKALALARQKPARRFLQRRLMELEKT